MRYPYCACSVYEWHYKYVLFGWVTVLYSRLHIDHLSLLSDTPSSSSLTERTMAHFHCTISTHTYSILSSIRHNDSMTPCHMSSEHPSPRLITPVIAPIPPSSSLSKSSQPTPYTCNQVVSRTSQTQNTSIIEYQRRPNIIDIQLIRQIQDFARRQPSSTTKRERTPCKVGSDGIQVITMPR